MSKQPFYQQIGLLGFNVGDIVSCTDYEGLHENIVLFLHSKDQHIIEKIYSYKSEQILILEDSPKLSYQDKYNYPFISERFIKV